MTAPPGSENQNAGERRQRTRRPPPEHLAHLAQNYSWRIQEREQVRQETARRIDEARSRQRRQDDRRETAAQFQTWLRNAGLESQWRQYLAQTPAADHRHEMPFLSWLHTSGAYPNGLEALYREWQAAKGEAPPDGRQQDNPPTTGLSNAAGARPGPKPTPAAGDNRAPRNVRNWLVAALIAGACIMAAISIKLAS